MFFLGKSIAYVFIGLFYFLFSIKSIEGRGAVHGKAAGGGGGSYYSGEHIQ